MTDKKLVKHIELVRDASKRSKAQLTFFEFTTAVAFSYFAQEQIDIAVVEVGMGGALDATNVINPEVAIITNVSLDHAEILGNTKEKIAREKAGIIKPGCTVVTAEENPHLVKIFEDRCRQQRARLHRVQREVSMEPLSETWHSQAFRTSGTVSGEFTVPLIGKHQLANVATALTSAALLNIPQAALRRGLSKTQWPGRLQVVSEKPFILIDGAHNEAGVLSLQEYIKEHQLKFDILVLGVKKDKDTAAIINKLTPLAKHVITTEGAYQPMPAAELSRLIPGSESISSVPSAVRHAIYLAGEEGKILITGSLYMIPEAMKVLNPNSQYPMTNQAPMTK